jgi:peptidoglycan/LPS O-acetylase OafA/YrhL
MTPPLEGARDVTEDSVHLDAVRGLAALIVASGHIRDLFLSSIVGAKTGASGASGEAPIHTINIGNEAVMVFFVLSGYLVGGSVLRSAARGSFRWGSYLTKRLTRLWVVLIPALLLGSALDHLGLRLFDQPGDLYTSPAGQDLVYPHLATLVGGKILLGNILFLQTILVPVFGTNVALWSLANEFWYYLLFPLVVLTFARRSQLWCRIVFPIAIALIAWLLPWEILRLFPVWMLGALVSVLPLRLGQKTAKVLAVLGALALVVSGIGVRRLSLEMYKAQWIIAVVFCGLLYLILHQRALAKRGIYLAVASFFSRISYTLYVVHIPFAVFLCAIVNRPWHLQTKSPAHIAIFAGATAASVGFAYLFYLAFEANTDRVREGLLQWDRRGWFR